MNCFLIQHFPFQSQEDDFTTLVASVQEQLRKVNYENFSLMNDACIYVDQTKTGFIPIGELKNISKSFKLPIQDHLLEKLLYHTKSNGDGHVDYQHFISFLNWRVHPCNYIVILYVHKIWVLILTKLLDSSYLSTFNDSKMN